MRVKSSRRQRHNKILKSTRGFRMTKNRLYKVAHEASVHAGQYAFMGRKLRKRQLRRTWITRLGAALDSYGVSYSKFINSLKKEKVELDRKILSDISITDPEAFKFIVEKVNRA
jgi:large subunit ribosomal protein L20